MMEQCEQHLASCRVGVHSGECIGGIVRTEMQRQTAGEVKRNQTKYHFNNFAKMS